MTMRKGTQLVSDTTWYELAMRFADKYAYDGDFDRAKLPPPPRSLRDLSSLKQYGLAISAIPDKDNPTLMTVYCNGICVFGGQREHFKLVPELSFKEEVDLTRQGSLEGTYIKVVDTLEQALNAHRQSLDQHEIQLRSPLQVYLGEAHANPVCISTIIEKLFRCEISLPGFQVTSTELEEKYRHQIELAWNCREGGDFYRLFEVSNFIWDLEYRVAAAALLETFGQEVVRSILNRFGCSVSEEELSLDEVTSLIKKKMPQRDQLTQLEVNIYLYHTEDHEVFRQRRRFKDGSAVSTMEFLSKLPNYLNWRNLLLMKPEFSSVSQIVSEEEASKLSDEDKARMNYNWRSEESRKILANGENERGIDPLEIIVQRINELFHTSPFSTPQKTADTRGYDQLSLREKCALLGSIKDVDGARIFKNVFDHDLRHNLRPQVIQPAGQCQEQLSASHRKLSEMLSQIAMNEGSYTEVGRSGSPIPFEEIAADPYQQSCHSLLSSLSEDSTFNTDRLLQERAFEMGKITAIHADANSFTHKSDRRPSNILLASDSFYRRCFQLGFNSFDLWTRFRWFKPAGSSHNPFFTDPLADKIIEGWEIARYGEGYTRSARVPEASEKDTRWLSFLQTALDKFKGKGP